MLHLHGLHDHQRLSCVHLVARCDMDGQHLARHGSCLSPANRNQPIIREPGSLFKLDRASGTLHNQTVVGRGNPVRSPDTVGFDRDGSVVELHVDHTNLSWRGCRLVVDQQLDLKNTTAVRLVPHRHGVIAVCECLCLGRH